MNQTTTGAVERVPRSALVPLVVILFVISFALLSMVVLEQDRTIKSQRSMVRLQLKGHAESSGPSSQLALSEPAMAPQSSQAQARERSPNESPSAQVPAVNVKPRVSVKPGRKPRRAQEPFPAKPPAELSDPSDMRRVLFSI
jgi:hypothetical protein